MSDTNESAKVLNKPSPKRPRRMAREPKVEIADQQALEAAPAKRQSKADLVLGLLTRPAGATTDQLVAATGWLPHTTRAALTVLRKKGHSINSEKLEGGRRYRAMAGAA